MSNLSVKEVCEKIWFIEEKYDLFNKKIKGIYFWKLVRMSLYYEITEKIGLYNQAHSKPSQKLIDKLIYLPKALINTHFHGVLKREKEKDYLIFEHPRKVKVNNEYIDKYTHYFAKKFDQQEYEIVDKPHLRKHYNKPSKNRSYFEHFYFLDFIKRKIFPVKLSKIDKLFISKLEEEFSEMFSSKISLINKIKFRVTHFKNEVIYYDKLLDKRKPKKVILVVSYGNEALIHSCKKNDVISIELQHGTISKYHLGYSFPNNQIIPYFPDQLYLFGRFWADSTPLPINSSKIINYGFPHLETSLKDFLTINSNKNQIIFVSQGVIGKEIAEIAYEFSKRNPNKKIIYKLHPGEYDRWREEYQQLLKASKLDNFNVIENNEKGLYRLFAESEFQVGVFSTAIYEGMSLGCKTVLLDLPGIEYMEYLIEKGIVKVSKNGATLSKIINDDNFKQNYNMNYFFSGLDS